MERRSTREELPDTNEEARTSTSTEERINHAIARAVYEDRHIDHAVARAIAAELHGGQASPLYALASSGAIVDGLVRELDACRQDEGLQDHRPWIDALDTYLGARATSPEPVEGWSELWPDSPPAPTPDDAEVRQALFERITAAGVRSLGSVAAVSTTERSAEEPDERQEQRHRLREALAAWNEGAERVDHATARELAQYFARHDDGALATMAGCGALLNTDDELFRELYAAWQEHDDEEQVWAEALRRYVLARERDGPIGPVDHWDELGSGEEPQTGDGPEIWIGSLSDYNNGILHGMWVKADRDVTELYEQIAWVLRTSPVARRFGEVAEEWGIFDHSGFGGYEVYEYAGMELVSRIARGVAEHGEPYAKWVAYVGDSNEELLRAERYLDHYQGTWDSAVEYVEHFLTETDAYDFLQFVPDSIRGYVTVDVEQYARDLASEGLLAEELGDGRVAVFWTH